MVINMCIFSGFHHTSACFKRSALLRRSFSIFCTAWPSKDIRTRRALTWAWTRTRACMHLSVTAACFLTCRPRTRAWSLTTPFKALRALLAYTSYFIVQFNQKCKLICQVFYSKFLLWNLGSCLLYDYLFPLLIRVSFANIGFSDVANRASDHQQILSFPCNISTQHLGEFFWDV